MVKIQKEELEQKYRSMRNEDLAEELGISLPTLFRLIDKAGIPRKGTGNSYKHKKIEVV